MRVKEECREGSESCISLCGIRAHGNSLIVRRVVVPAFRICGAIMRPAVDANGPVDSLCWCFADVLPWYGEK